MNKTKDAIFGEQLRILILRVLNDRENKRLKSTISNIISAVLERAELVGELNAAELDAMRQRVYHYLEKNIKSNLFKREIHTNGETQRIRIFYKLTEKTRFYD